MYQHIFSYYFPARNYAAGKQDLNDPTRGQSQWRQVTLQQNG